LPTEEIAFLDTSLIVNAEFARSLLGLQDDSLVIVTDSLVIEDDSLAIEADSLTTLTDSLGTVADSLTTVTDSLVTVADSSLIMADTTRIENDSLITSGPDLNSIYIDLLLFIEESTIQYITDYNRDDPRKRSPPLANQIGNCCCRPSGQILYKHPPSGIGSLCL